MEHPQWDLLSLTSEEPIRQRTHMTQAETNNTVEEQGWKENREKKPLDETPGLLDETAF